MGIVYIIWSRDTGTYKIGYSRAKNAKSRLEAVKTGHPFSLQLVREWTVNNPRKLEERLHARFSAKRIRGEWFSLDESDLTEADAVVRTFDDNGEERKQRKRSTRRVALYSRDNKGYHFADPRALFVLGTKFYLRFEMDGTRQWEALPKGTNHKEARKLLLDKEIELENQMVIVPGLKQAPPKPSVISGYTSIHSAIDAYIDALWAEGNLRAKTIKGKKFELYRWMGWCSKQFMEQLDRSDMIAFRDRLLGEGLADWTVESNMMSVTTMLKHNPLRSVVGLVKPQDWVEIPDSEPEPYTVEEVHALLRVASGDESLLIRFLVGTGCRDMEVGHLRWEDIDWSEKTIWVRSKKCNCSECAQSKGIWKPKTRAGTRKVPISDALVVDLKKRRKPSGLVFPAPGGGVDRHYYRIIETLAAKAGVENPGVHRFRDTWATSMLRNGVDIFTLRKWIGHEGLETLKLYADSLKAKDQQARDAANMQDRYSLAARAAHAAD